MKRSSRKQVSEETLKIIERGSYQNAHSQTVSIRSETNFAVKNSRLFRTEDFPGCLELTKTAGETKFEVTAETTLEAAARICAEDEGADPFVLNFASAKNPGGGFLNGSQAQEESLARSSSLYACLQANFEMYQFNRAGNSCLYSDWMIYSPRVPVFRNDDGDLLEKFYAVSFLTSPAVNAGAVKQKEPDKIALIESVNRERARKVLWVANQNQHQILILGAWGCGVFGNDPEMIARIFDDLLRGEFAGCFQRVVMAIYDRTPNQEVLTAFQAKVGK
ncbi:MAG TPA: TIGR02452 family protein [Abditibacterium sp.]|jgi:uncharacterized protein (TIGR02452 family)